MDYSIRTLNAISPAIYGPLGSHYHVSDKEEAPDAILVRSAKMHDMPLPESLLAIARAGAGTNNIPIDACSEKGICVFNTPGANANAVCELVIAGLLLSCRNIVGGIEWARTLSGHGEAIEKEVEKGKSAFVGPELRGKTLGVIGLGAIGVLVANAAVALGMNVVGYDPMISVEHAWKLSRSVRHENSLDALFSVCDFITVHVPLNDKTRGLVGRRAFSLCRKGIRIMNFARGGLVDEDALIGALGDGTVSAYVTDFASDRLLSCEGVLCLPHLGASTPESEENCVRLIAGQMNDYLTNGTIRNSVNYPSCALSRVTMPRLTVLHKNVPNVIGPVTSALASGNLNIENMVNQSRGEYAYTVLDLSDKPDEKTLAKLQEMDVIYRVRLLMPNGK